MHIYIPSYLCVCCMIQNPQNYDGDDDDDDDDDDDSYLDFVYLTENTTCREDNNANSCYASIFTNPVYATVAEALVSLVI